MWTIVYIISAISQYKKWTVGQFFLEEVLQWLEFCNVFGVVAKMVGRGGVGVKALVVCFYGEECGRKLGSVEGGGVAEIGVGGDGLEFEQEISEESESWVVRVIRAVDLLGLARRFENLGYRWLASGRRTST